MARTVKVLLGIPAVLLIVGAGMSFHTVVGSLLAMAFTTALLAGLAGTGWLWFKYQMWHWKVTHTVWLADGRKATIR